MSCLNNRYLKIFFASVLISLFPAVTGAAQAATTNLYATINPGTLTVSAAATASISAVTLEGVSQSSTGALGEIGVTDNRGTGSGWSVTVSVSDFSCCNGTRTIAVKNLTLNPGLLTVISGKGEGVSAGEPHVFTGTVEAATLIKAVSGGGLGSYKVAPTLTLSIPAETYAGSYTAVLTVTVI